MADNLPIKEALTVLELNHIAFYVRDLEASIRFYGGVLGLPPLARPAFDFAGAWFALGSQELHLIEDTQNQDKERHSLHVAFLVEDAAACAEALRGRGVTNMRDPAPRPDGAVQVFLSDPDGYLLEIVSQPSAEKRL
jgi:catechol 2,3-dioxygenase-like lactoylglutathione lyase family enzyme